MEIISNQPKWEQLCSITPSNNNLKVFLICQKRLFRKRRLYGTNIKITPNSIIEDYTVMRYGVEFINRIYLSYKYNSKIYCFYAFTTAMDFIYNEIHLPIKLEKKGKRRIFHNIKYWFNHIELILAEINLSDKIVMGYIDEPSLQCILTKRIKILSCKNRI